MDSSTKATGRVTLWNKARSHRREHEGRKGRTP